MVKPMQAPVVVPQQMPNWSPSAQRAREAVQYSGLSGADGLERQQSARLAADPHATRRVAAAPVRVTGSVQCKAPQTSDSTEGGASVRKVVGSSPHSWSGPVQVAPKAVARHLPTTVCQANGECMEYPAVSKPSALSPKKEAEKPKEAAAAVSPAPRGTPARPRVESGRTQEALEERAAFQAKAAGSSNAAKTPASGAAALVGQPYIDFEFEDLDGGQVHKVSDFVGKGKPVVLEFHTFW